MDVDEQADPIEEATVDRDIASSSSTPSAATTTKIKKTAPNAQHQDSGLKSSNGETEEVIVVSPGTAIGLNEGQITNGTSHTEATVVVNDAGNITEPGGVAALLNSSVNEANAVPETQEEEQQQQHHELQIEEAGIDPNYPLVLVERVPLPSNDGGNRESSPSVDHNVQENAEAIVDEMRYMDVLSYFHIDQLLSSNETGEDSETAVGSNEGQIINGTSTTDAGVVDEAEGGSSADGGSRSQSLGSTAEASETVDANALPESQDDIDQQQQHELQIEEAGIDPNYPLVLVQRVSLPSNDEDPLLINQDNAQENADGESSMDEIPAMDLLDLFHTDRAEANNVEAVVPDRAEDEGEVDMDTWSEDDEDENAIGDNPNLREFSNQFVVIRNMIAQTRRSMAEAEANLGPSEMLPRNMLMQRFRRILFILNNRRRRLRRLGMNTPDEENPEGEANAEMEAANEDNENDAEAEYGDNNPDNDDANMMSIEQEEDMNENAVRFDTNLPAEHSYLGPNMNRVSGVNYLDVDQYVKLRLFIHQHVLFPGEVLPFMVDSSTTVIEGDIDAQNGILFGVCFPSLTSYNATNNGGKNEPLLYGVTCQIYELGTDDRGNTLIKSRALQRFVTKVNDLTVPLEYINSHPRMKCTGFVKILPDVYLPEPLKHMNMGSMNRFRDISSMQETYRRFQAATTPWPVHVYETHNMTTIVEKARTQLAQHKIDTMPSDPTQLSYWLVRNLHLPEKMLKSVFLANTVNTRLKLIASTFKEEAVFSCRSCGTHIANCRELFAMSKHGVQSQYCNSAGYIHETNTVYQVNRPNILYSGAPSAEFSWFPGYQWHIIVCKICEHHLGWEFKAVEPNLIPKQFFGISSGSVRVRSANERADEQTQGQNAFYNFIRLMNAGVVNIE